MDLDIQFNEKMICVPVYVELDAKDQECATVTGGGRVAKPPLHPIHVQRPFEILGVDVMELPKTTSANKFCTFFFKII